MTKFEPAEEVINAVEQLVDVAIVRHAIPNADETLTECCLCGDWEGHTDDCPMPAVLAWREDDKVKK
jgi:hypothetical protein